MMITVMTLCCQCSQPLSEEEQTRPVALIGGPLWTESRATRNTRCDRCCAYTPRCLPKLPRRRCAYLYITAVNRYGSKVAGYLVPAPCTTAPQANGWCKHHQYIQGFLEEGARLGYPRLQINEGNWLGDGIGGWEAFAQHYSPARRQEVMQAIARWKERYAENISCNG